MKQTKIQVSKQDIENAVRRNSHHCMIADAIKRQVPNAKYIMVDVQSTRFTDLKAGKRYCYFTPPIAQSALLAFDQGKPVKPFALTLCQGMIRKSGWQSNHPKQTRKGRKYRATGRIRVLAKVEREFGLRKLVV